MAWILKPRWIKWMTINKLQLNEEKIDSVLFSSHNIPSPKIPNIDVSCTFILVANSAKNIGDVLDSTLLMAKYLSTIWCV